MVSLSSSLSPVYLLNCSVCEEEFCGTQIWLDHLTQDGHQKVAKKEYKQLVNSDLNNNLMECSLVVFTTYDLTAVDAGKIVEYFGTRNQTTLVTDFVWWEDRPRIGIIQFESRSKVDEVLTGIDSLSSGDLLIDNQRVQVRRALDMLDLELNALLPGKYKKPQNPLEPLPSRKRGRKSQSEPEEHPSKKNCESSSPPNHPPPPSTSTPETENSSLQSQYLSIRKLVVIPDHLLSKATKAVSSLKALFRRNDPSAELTVFRTWHLNLTSTLSSSSSDDMEDLVVYLYRTISPPEVPSSYSWVPRERICQLLYHIEKAPDTKVFSILDKDPDVYTWRLKYTGSSGDPSIPIRLISHKLAMAEVQICRIYKYMMTFDPRFEHVLSLLYLWTSVNEVTIGDSDSNRRSRISLPEPLTMQWLLMQFMCYRKYVPTVREIQSRPHPVLRDRMKGIDIGFEEDPKFVEEWKMACGWGWGEESLSSDKLVEDVLQLFLEFFEFCWMTLDGNASIFNTKDGEVLRTESFLSCKPGTNGDMAWTTEMTREEVQLLRGLHNGDDDSAGGKKLTHAQNQYKINLRSWNLYMVHPFIFTCNFSVNWDIGFVVKLMKATEKKLRGFLNKNKCGGLEAAERQFGKLENLLTVDKVTREKIWGKKSRKSREW